LTEPAFHRPHSLEEALSLLAADPAARCLAGGATLVAMMNANLVEPDASPYYWRTTASRVTHTADRAMIGEPPIVGIAAAVNNALHHATGLRLYQLPITSERVWRGLRAMSRERDGGLGL